MTTTLVLGGTGKTGARLADVLRRSGRAVRVGSRRAAPAFIALPAGDVAEPFIDASDLAAAAVDTGVPQAEVEPLTELFTRVLDGHNACLTSDVELVLGRPPRDFADYARDTAATGVWTQRARP